MEFWKQTQYENYEVSNTGKVRNTKTNKILNGSIGKSNGYWRISISIGDKGNKYTKTMEVHRLVAETFHGLHSPLVVDHIDGNKLNNDESNLQWISQANNLAKAKKRTKKERMFTFDEYESIYVEFLSNKQTITSITHWINNKFNMNHSRPNIGKMMRGDTYKIFYNQLNN